MSTKKDEIVWVFRFADALRGPDETVRLHTVMELSLEYLGWADARTAFTLTEVTQSGHEAKAMMTITVAPKQVTTKMPVLLGQGDRFEIGNERVKLADGGGERYLEIPQAVYRAIMTAATTKP